jgi:predicted ester cyclase
MLDYEDLGIKIGEMWCTTDKYKAFVDSAIRQVRLVTENYISNTLAESIVPKLANYTEKEIYDFEHNFYLEVMEHTIRKIRKDLEEVE